MHDPVGAIFVKCAVKPELRLCGDAMPWYSKGRHCKLVARAPGGSWNRGYPTLIAAGQ